MTRKISALPYLIKFFLFFDWDAAALLRGNSEAASVWSYNVALLSTAHSVKFINWLLHYSALIASQQHGEPLECTYSYVENPVRIERDYGTS